MPYVTAKSCESLIFSVVEEEGPKVSCRAQEWVGQVLLMSQVFEAAVSRRRRIGVCEVPRVKEDM